MQNRERQRAVKGDDERRKGKLHVQVEMGEKGDAQWRYVVHKGAQYTFVGH